MNQNVNILNRKDNPNPKFTIGMATFRDFDGVYFTVQSLRLYHANVLHNCEIVVVDNDPRGPHRATLTAFCEKVNARYIPFEKVQGTAAPRNKIFEVARGEYVLCMDSHIMLAPYALEDLITYYSQNPDTKDLIQGPLLYDQLNPNGISTHFDNVWRGEMWGTWGLDKRGLDPSSPPFEIFAQGLGLFSSRKDVWLSLGGFNPNFRGFGGEECYIHEKFRKNGGKCLCIPSLRWLHRFGRPAGVQYRLTRMDKVRNYYIGHMELGLDPKPIYEHFVASGLITENQWQGITNPVSIRPMSSTDISSEPIGKAEVISVMDYRREANKKGDSESPNKGCGCAAFKYEDIEEWYKDAASKPSDINEHVPTLRMLAEESKQYGKGIIVELGTRYGTSTVALLTAKPELLVSVDVNESREVGELRRLTPEGSRFHFVKRDSRNIIIPECDLLFIDTIHTADHVWAELSNTKDKVRGRIAFHDTVIYGERGEDGGPGLLPAIRRFLKENQEWTVIRHDKNNHGFFVISNLPQDKKELPGTARQVWNFTKALTKHKLSGSKKVPIEVAEQRLDICAVCPSRSNDRCGECGCFLNDTPIPPGVGKAWWADQSCPIGKWHEYISVDTKEESNNPI